jgi:hypothetical protein
LRLVTAGAAMSVFIEVLAWIVIAFGAVAVVVTLISLEAGRHARNQRHGRAVPFAEAWSDLRAFLPLVAIGVSLLGNRWQPGTPGWWLPQVPLLATMTLYLGTWIWSRTRGTPATPEADRERRNFLLAFAATIPLVTYDWKADTAGWWLMHIPILAAGVVCGEAVLQYLMRRKSGGSTAEPS